MRSAAIIKGETFHNGQTIARKVTGFDGLTIVNYVESGTGRTGNCSIAQCCKWAKGIVR